MPIPESQLETWSHQGSIRQSSETYNSLKNLLESRANPYSEKSFKVFLQGSYGNDTNIHAESDVDIIIRLDECFYSDIDSLSEAEKEGYKDAFVDAGYGYAEFKRDVLSALKSHYGAAIRPGDKAIVVDSNSSRRKSDVIVATKFRRYFRFPSPSDAEFAEGICFFNGQGERIANYPEQHSANLTTKHQATNQWLKPMARVFKNMRNRMIDIGLIESGIAPSYYIEGLLYNVPTERFGSSYQRSMYSIFDWYQREASKLDLVCANEQYYLLRDDCHTCWPQKNCDSFVEAAIELWNNWPA